MDRIERTLQEIDKVICAFSEDYKLDQKSYNVLKVLEVTEKEVLMCRLLTDFLNPEGLHNQGDKYLKSFLRNVLGEKDVDSICMSAHVYKEYPICGDRRIDIVITSSNRFIPIEVKINAKDQNSQCYDYYHYAKQYDNKAKVVYLTKCGYMPSDGSLSSSNGKDKLELTNVLCISFLEDIIGWVSDLIEKEDNPAMAEVLKQYKEAIEEFTVFANEELQMEVANKINESYEHFRSMLVIEKAASKAKALLITNVMKEIENQMIPIAKKYRFERENRSDWYEYTDKATEVYYKQRESTYPGINYVVKNVVLPNGKELWFRVEVDYALFSGFCLFEPNTKSENGGGKEIANPSNDQKRALAEYMNIKDATYDGWWVQWWYLPNGATDYSIDEDRIPNFKDMNEAAIRLSNVDVRREFVAEVVRVIDKKLGILIK